jgi:hypothetical protein
MFVSCGCACCQAELPSRCCSLVHKVQPIIVYLSVVEKPRKGGVPGLLRVVAPWEKNENFDV